jgi:hypothetical protein
MKTPEELIEALLVKGADLTGLEQAWLSRAIHDRDAEHASAYEVQRRGHEFTAGEASEAAVLRARLARAENALAIAGVAFEGIGATRGIPALVKHECAIRCEHISNVLKPTVAARSDAKESE